MGHSAKIAEPRGARQARTRKFARRSRRDGKTIIRNLLTIAGSGAVRRGSILVFLELADMVLRVELEPELGDQVELGLEKIDVLFLVMHQLLEQVARHVGLHAVAMGGGLLVEQARRYFGGEVAIEDLLHV